MQAWMWRQTETDAALYIEDRQTLNSVLAYARFPYRDAGKAMTYTRSNGRVYAWQFTIPAGIWNGMVRYLGRQAITMLDMEPGSRRRVSEPEAVLPLEPPPPPPSSAKAPRGKNSSGKSRPTSEEKATAAPAVVVPARAARTAKAAAKAAAVIASTPVTPAASAVSAKKRTSRPPAPSSDPVTEVGAKKRTTQSASATEPPAPKASVATTQAASSEKNPRRAKLAAIPAPADTPPVTSKARATRASGAGKPVASEPVSEVKAVKVAEATPRKLKASPAPALPLDVPLPGVAKKPSRRVATEAAAPAVLAAAVPSRKPAAPKVETPAQPAPRRGAASSKQKSTAVAAPPIEPQSAPAPPSARKRGRTPSG